MSITRACQHCKWKFPETYKKRVCMFCEGPMDTFKCYKCKEWFHHTDMRPKNDYCKQCELDRRNVQRRKRPHLAAATYQRKLYKYNKEEMDAMEKLSEVRDMSYKPLTEEEWLTVCSYFDGCAICGSEFIESRSFFLPVRKGGRYTAWNVILTCGTCAEATMTNTYKNPFRWLKSDTAIQLGLTQARANKLKNYLMNQIEKVKE